MPEYLAPGVYVEETGFRPKSIEGVGTTTTAFVGPTRDGPVCGEPRLLTTFEGFCDVHGGPDALDYEGTRQVNYVAQAVRAFFAEGGKRLYVARVFKPLAGAGADGPSADGGRWPDGVARWSSDSASAVPPGAFPRTSIRSRHPGAAGNRSVTLRFRLGPNAIDTQARPATLRGVQQFDVCWVQTQAEANGSPPKAGQLYWVDCCLDAQGRPGNRLRRGDPSAARATAEITDFSPLAQVRLLTVAVTVEGRGPFRGRFDTPTTFENLGFHPGPLGPGPRRSLVESFPPEPVPATPRPIPIVFETPLRDAVEIAELLVARRNRADTDCVFGILAAEVLGGVLAGNGPARRPASDAELSTVIELRGGSDGLRPDADDYRGTDLHGQMSGLRACEPLEDVSIVAAPGSTFDGLRVDPTGARAVTGALLAHCEHMRYRIAVLDGPDGASPADIRDWRSRFDSKYGALYYPWVKTLDAVSAGEILVPPSGFVAGIYARNDLERGVHRAPANELVRSATGFEFPVTKAQQELLNPEGINCLRFFEGRGLRVWGARTVSSDPEWKYVNVRRHLAYLERSIDRGTQWAVFEPNDERLWGNVRRLVEDFLSYEWSSGRLAGSKPEEAYFVRCDRSTMTQDDIDSGRMICVIGVAPVRPAEFVVFRIGQWTADRRA
jgi:hypothetical protein